MDFEGKERDSTKDYDTLTQGRFPKGRITKDDRR